MKADDVKQIAVVGAGLMGHGIAQEFALAGYAVHMHARTEASLGTARAHIERNLDYLVGLGRLSRAQADAAPSRLHATTRVRVASSRTPMPPVPSTKLQMPRRWSSPPRRARPLPERKPRRSRGSTWRSPRMIEPLGPLPTRPR